MLTFTLACKTSLHCLMQLSTTEWSRVKDNSIIIQGLFGNDLKSYNDVKLGQNVKAPLKHLTSDGNTIHCKLLDLHNVKDQYAVIVAKLITIQSLVGSGEVTLIDNLEGSDVDRALGDKLVLCEFILLAITQASNKNATTKVSGWNCGKTIMNLSVSQRTIS